MIYEAAAAWDASMAAWGASPRTRKSRLQLLAHLERQHGWHTLEQVTREDCERFLGTPGFAEWTRCTHHTSLKGFFGWAHEAGLIDVSPMQYVRRPRTPKSKPKPLNEAQVEAAMALAAGNSRTWLILALYAGLRSDEIGKIRGEDVDVDHLFVKGKGGKEALIPTHPKIWQLAQQHPRHGWWFPATTASGHINGMTISNHIGYLFRDAGIATGSIHRCRHTYATRLLRQGANIRVVQDVMRHSSLATTQVYLEVNDTERRDAIAGLV